MGGHPAARMAEEPNAKLHEYSFGYCRTRRLGERRLDEHDEDAAAAGESKGCDEQGGVCRPIRVGRLSKNGGHPPKGGLHRRRSRRRRGRQALDRKSTRLNSSTLGISYA